MQSEKFQKFAGKELTKYGMGTIAGGEDTLIILVSSGPKKVFPSSSSATNIKPGGNEEDLLKTELELVIP